MIEVVTDFVLPIGGSVLLGAGLLSWLSVRPRPSQGQLHLPRRWESTSILLGAALLALYIAFFAPFDSSTLRVIMVLIIVGSVGLNVWIIRTAVRRNAHSETGSDHHDEPVVSPRRPGRKTRSDCTDSTGRGSQ